MRALTVTPKRLLNALASDRRGIAALEYGLIAGVLGLVLIGIFQNLGTQLQALFSTIGSSL